MKYYWINCEKSKNRRKYMDDQFNNLNISNKRVDAITPDTLPVIKKPTHFKGSDLELSCLCSHLKALQEALQEGEEWFIIMEDDVKIAFDINYEKLIKEVEGAEVIQLYTSTPHQEGLEDLYNKNINFVAWNVKLYGSCAYLINKKAASKLLNTFIKNNVYDFSNFPYLLVADTVIFMALKTATSTYPLFYNDNYINKSIIHKDHNDYHILVADHVKNVIKTIKPPSFCSKKL